MASSATSSRSTIQRTEVGEESLAVSLVTAIAAAKDADPMELDVQLSDRIDLDAIEALYDHAEVSDAAAWTIEFAIDDLDVTVESDGRITVS